MFYSNVYSKIIYIHVYKDEFLTKAKMAWLNLYMYAEYERFSDMVTRVREEYKSFHKFSYLFPLPFLLIMV